MAMKVCYTVVNGQVLSENRGGVERDYIPDSQGNTIALMDSTGTLTDTFSYFPSGAIASRTGTTPTPFQWNGRSGYYRDTPTRNYVRARNFYVNLGRWSTPDPIGFEGGDFNLYRYVKNKFVNTTDPSGLQMMTFVNRDFISVEEDRARGEHVSGRNCQTNGITDFGPLWLRVPVNPFEYTYMKSDHRDFFEEGTSRIKTGIRFDSCRIGALTKADVRINTHSDPSYGLFLRGFLSCFEERKDTAKPTANILNVTNFGNSSSIFFEIIGINPHVPLGPPIRTNGVLRVKDIGSGVHAQYSTIHTRYPWRDAWLQRGEDASVCRWEGQCVQIYTYRAKVGDVIPGLTIPVGGFGVGYLKVETPRCGCRNGGSGGDWDMAYCVPATPKKPF